jgi:hypothetical protein
VLSDSDYVVYEYHKCYHAKKYPLLVLTYVGVRGTEMPCQEIVFGLDGMEKEIQQKKMKVIRKTVKRGILGMASHGI